MKIKVDRTVGGPWHPAIEHAADIIDRVWRAHTGKQARVTGLGEEGHSESSLHYGIPGDIRLRAIDVDADEQHCTAAQRIKIHNDLLRRLGTEFDVIWEAMGTPNAHLHVEFQPEPVET